MRTCWHRRFFSAATEVLGPWSIEQLEKIEKVLVDWASCRDYRPCPGSGIASSLIDRPGELETERDLKYSLMQVLGDDRHFNFESSYKYNLVDASISG